MDSKIMQYRQKSLFWPNFEDSQPSIAKMAKRIAIFIRFQIFWVLLSFASISSAYALDLKWPKL